MENTTKLNEAFDIFTKASKSLETYYEKLTERVRYLTQELEKKNAQLEEMEHHHKRNLRLIAMGEMAATIVHEIRSPLCSIELFSNMLSNDLKGTKHSDMANGISTGIKSLNNILTNMLLFAKPQKPCFKKFRLRDVVEESINMIIPLIEIRNIEISKEMSDNMITGDAELLKQVFMNIILNAVQSMEHGGTLKIAIDTGKGYVTASVVDEGDGIDPEEVEKIFDPFYSTKERGTGLGLTIAHRIMQSHDGFIRAYRNIDKGSTFSVYFPDGEDVNGSENRQSFSEQGV